MGGISHQIYPFHVNDDYISDGFETLSTGEVDYPESEDESVERCEFETTDSSFKAACFNIRLIAINESCFSIPAFMELQTEDEFCFRKIELIKKKDSRTLDSGYFLKRNILMRKMQTRDMQFYNVICVPQVIVKPLLESSHRSLLSGHFGSNRYLLNMKRKYFWPRMKDDVIDFHRSCLPCQYNDKYPIKYSSGYVIRPLWPMHIVHCDLIVGLPRALDGSYAILLLYDGFSRLTYGIPLASEKADYVVKKLMSHFVSAYGLPWALHSDNGRNVDGALIRHLARMLGVLKTSTPPHTPNANPTETMCGAVSMLLRKALNESDKRYWSLCLPFILNALNSTVHTATGYTPNSLFFGRFKERDPVPLIPFDSETANVNEYFQKMRRFQELAFQIVRSRNQRKLLARKETWDSTAKCHTFTEGDFVLVKNNNPASGPGKMKLRAKYLGPFRIIKAYTSSLIVVPWTENSRLDEYYKDPDVFRLIHRGDIKPFYTRQVAVKHCKPFRGNIESEQIIDPIMLTRFLDSLGVDSQDDLVSEMDPARREDSVTDSMSSYDPRPPRPPRGDPRGPPNGNGMDSDDSDGDDPPPNIPQPPPPPVVPVPPMPGPLPLAFPENLGAVRRRNQDVRFNQPEPIDNLVDNLDVSLDAREVLKKYYKKQADLTAMSAVASNYHHKIKELERLVRHPDPDIRRRAEYELQEAMDMIRVDMNKARESSESLSLSESSHSEHDNDNDGDSFHSEDKIVSDTNSEGSIQPLNIDEGDQLFDMPSLEWASDEEPFPNLPPQPQGINIRTPNLDINIRAPVARTPVTRSQTLAARTPIAGPPAEAVHSPVTRSQTVAARVPVAKPPARVIHTPVTRLRIPVAHSPVAGPSRMMPAPTAPNRERLWKSPQ